MAKIVRRYRRISLVFWHWVYYDVCLPSHINQRAGGPLTPVAFAIWGHSDDMIWRRLEELNPELWQLAT